MPDKKSCSTKCYCNKTVCGPLGKVQNRASITSNKSQLEFVKLKHDYDALPAANQGYNNFSRRSSTSSVDSLATPSSASTNSSCCHQQKQQNTNCSDRVNKLKHSDQRTLYEQLRLAGEEPGYLIKAAQEEEEAAKRASSAKVYLFDAAYLKALQEFRLSNRSECFGK